MASRRRAVASALACALCAAAAARSEGTMPAPIALQAAFSRLGARGLAGTISAAELPAFLGLAAIVDTAHRLDEHTAEIVDTLRQQLEKANGKGPYTLADILGAARAYAADISAQEPHVDSVTFAPGSKQLRQLRERLAVNRMRMPMFDTKGWVRDFEKSLVMQWEIYASGLKPMHIVVARSSHIYGIADFNREIPGYYHQ